MNAKMIIEFSNPDIMQPKPWPVGIDMETGKALSGLGNDDGAMLIGFGIKGAQSVDVWFTPGEEFDGLELIEGLVPTFSNGGGFFEWGTPIKAASIQQPVKDIHFTLDIQMSNDAMQTGFDISAALERVRGQVYELDGSVGNTGRIADENGQKVGTWSFVEVAR